MVTGLPGRLPLAEPDDGLPASKTKSSFFFSLPVQMSLPVAGAGAALAVSTGVLRIEAVLVAGACDLGGLAGGAAGCAVERTGEVGTGAGVLSVRAGGETGGAEAISN